MIKKIFFDLDGTLIDQKTAQNQAIEKLFWKYGFDKATELHAFVAKWDELTEYHYDNRYLKRLCTYEEQRAMRVIGLFDFFDLPLDEKDALGVYDVYLRLFENSWKAFSDVVPCLVYLESMGLELGVITNGDMAQQRLKLERTGIAHFFSYIVAAGEYNCTKPDPELFRIACKQCDMTTDEVVYIGDSYSFDIVPCKTLGIKCLLINRKNKPITDDSVEVISSLDEVAGRIERYRTK